MTTLAMLTTILVALITAVIGPLLMTWFKNKLEGNKNFSISWDKLGSQVVQTNTISFVLPSIFGHFFTQKKTIDDYYEIRIRKYFLIAFMRTAS